MSGTVCSYKGCSKSYSTHKDIPFFKFPDDVKRRKKWMENCANPDLQILNDRQLRLKRVCADHFSPSSFLCAVTRTQLTDRAVPMSQKESEAANKAAEEAEKEPPVKRGRGRPPASSKGGLAVVKREPEPEYEDEEEEEDFPDDKAAEEGNPNENGDVDYTPPPTLKRQIRGDSEGAKGRVGRPPKLMPMDNEAASSSSTPTTSKGKLDKEQQGRKSLPPKPKSIGDMKSRVEGEKRSSTGGVRRMADLSVIEDVVNEMRLGVEMSSKGKKRPSSAGVGVEENKGKRKSLNGTDNLDDEDSDMEVDEDEEEEEEDGLERANREFEMFQSGLRKIIQLPMGWGMGAVVWDPLNKRKVIPIVLPKLQHNGTITLFRSIQIYEDSAVRVMIDGVDMTINFGIQAIESEDDVNKIIKAVAEARVCSGVENFQPDDMIYLPDARKRGYKYFSDACPVILDQNVEGDVCSPCLTLQKAVLERNDKEKEELANRKLRPVPKTLKNEFGRSFYGLLNEILEDSNALKSDNKDEREAVLSKYSTELGVMNGEIHKPEKIPHVQVSVDEVSASFQDIVQRLGFSLNKKPGPGGTPTPAPQSHPQIPRPRPRIEDNRSPFANKPFLSKFVRPPQPKPATITRPTLIPFSTSVSIPSNASTFSLGDGQTFEILGEVGTNEIVQGPKGEAIEIIEVDDETMAKLTAQNSGVLFQNATPGQIQVATLDPSDPNISQILKAINPSQA